MKAYKRMLMKGEVYKVAARTWRCGCASSQFHLQEFASIRVHSRLSSESYPPREVPLSRPRQFAVNSIKSGLQDSRFELNVFSPSKEAIEPRIDANGRE